MWQCLEWHIAPDVWTTRRVPIASVAKKHGISEQTIYTWRKRFGALQSDDVRRLRQLKAENACLKKLVAERDLEIEVMKEINAKNWWACRLAVPRWRSRPQRGCRSDGLAR